MSEATVPSGPPNVISITGLPWQGANKGVENGGDPPDPPDMEARVAVLEQIAKDTKEALVALRSDLWEQQAEFSAEMRSVRADFATEMRAQRTAQRTDFLWTLGIMLGGFAALLGTMAHGFRWL